MPDRRYPRMARVNELVREVLAEELERLSDPRVGFLTVTGVDVANDLRHGTVYYSVLKPGPAPEETADALRSLKPQLKAVLGREARLKYVPDLVFKEDPALVTGERVEQIIRDIHAAAPAAGVDTVPPAGPGEDAP